MGTDWGRGQSECEWRSEAFFLGGGSGQGGSGWGHQGGWERRCEAFVKIQLFFFGGGGVRSGGGGGRRVWGGGGVRVYVNGKVKFL